MRVFEPWKADFYRAIAFAVFSITGTTGLLLARSPVLAFLFSSLMAWRYSVSAAAGERRHLGVLVEQEAISTLCVELADTALKIETDVTVQLITRGIFKQYGNIDAVLSAAALPVDICIEVKSYPDVTIEDGQVFRSEHKYPFASIAKQVALQRKSLLPRQSISVVWCPCSAPQGITWMGSYWLICGDAETLPEQIILAIEHHPIKYVVEFLDDPGLYLRQTLADNGFSYTAEDRKWQSSYPLAIESIVTLAQLVEAKSGRITTKLVTQ